MAAGALSDKRLQKQLKFMLETEEDRQQRLRQYRDKARERREKQKPKKSARRTTPSAIEDQSRRSDIHHVQDVTVLKRRSPGRPHKNPLQTPVQKRKLKNSATQRLNADESESRRKDEIPEVVTLSSDQEVQNKQEPPARRGRGRPRKHPVQPPVSQKTVMQQPANRNLGDDTGTRSENAPPRIVTVSRGHEKEKETGGKPVRKTKKYLLQLYPHLAQLNPVEQKKQLRLLVQMMETEEERTARLEKKKKYATLWYQRLSEVERKQFSLKKNLWRRRKREKKSAEEEN